MNFVFLFNAPGSFAEIGLFGAETVADYEIFEALMAEFNKKQGYKSYIVLEEHRNLICKTVVQDRSEGWAQGFVVYKEQDFYQFLCFYMNFLVFCIKFVDFRKLHKFSWNF